VITVELPLRIESVANLREHYFAKARRTKAHRKAALAVLPCALPARVILVRIAPRALDGDNLQAAFKGFRDGIADRFGVKDNDPRLEWRYAQERGKPREYAVRVEITRLELFS
jgi:hypothetical protein